MQSKTVFSERGDWKEYAEKGDSEDTDLRVTGDDVRVRDHGGANGWQS